MRLSTPDTPAADVEREIFAVVERQASRIGRRVAIRRLAGETTYEELGDLYDRARSRVAAHAGQRVGVAMDPSAAWVSVVAALARTGAHVFLFSPNLERSRAEELAAHFSLQAVVDQDGGIRRLLPAGKDGRAHGRLTFLTSGSTGIPKAVTHSWASLMRPVRFHSEIDGARWLLIYPAHLYSGLQVLLQSLISGGTLIVAGAREAPVLCRQIRDERVECVPAAPSFWRWLLTFGDRDALRQSSIRQISLGGEPVPEALLQDLKDAFPGARIVHIYATSELGRCFSVTDGQAGFPAAYLTRCPERGVELRVVDGELQVRSANSMLGYADGAPSGGPPAWVATGDLVEISGGRVRFQGRTSEVINAGGHKVSPLEVENVLRRVSGVADACAYGIPSSLVGQMVAADLELAPGGDADEARRAVAHECAVHLQSHQRPRILRFVEHLSRLESGKLDRRQQQRRTL